MRTIDKVLKYNLSSEETESLLDCGIINWCWGEWGFSFDDLLESNLKHLTVFDPEKLTELKWDFKRICYEHDIDFRFQIGFRKANYRMARKIFAVLYWTPWKVRYGVSIGTYLWLCKYGKKYYNVIDIIKK